MNAATPRPPSDDELDQLLASKLRRTSPEFELRWRTLRAELVAGRKARTMAWPQWLLWPGLAALALGISVVALRYEPSAGAPAAAISIEEIFALDAALQPASTLLDAENRDALIHLPAQPHG